MEHHWPPAGHRLLAEDKLTFTLVQELTQAMELSAKDIKESQVGATQQPTPFNKVQGQGGAAKGSKNSSSCYRCGGKHLASRYWFKTEKCLACGKVCYIAKMCCTKKREKKSSKLTLWKKQASRRVHLIPCCSAAILIHTTTVHSQIEWERIEHGGGWIPAPPYR